MSIPNKFMTERVCINTKKLLVNYKNRYTQYIKVIILFKSFFQIYMYLMPKHCRLGHGGSFLMYMYSVVLLLLKLILLVTIDCVLRQKLIDQIPQLPYELLLLQLLCVLQALLALATRQANSIVILIVIYTYFLILSKTSLDFSIFFRLL